MSNSHSTPYSSLPHSPSASLVNFLDAPAHDMSDDMFVDALTHQEMSIDDTDYAMLQRKPLVINVDFADVRVVTEHPPPLSSSLPYHTP